MNGLILIFLNRKKDFFVSKKENEIEMQVQFKKMFNVQKYK